jgi:6-phosphogluconate dehydrogenase (decarboxylating)
MALEDEMQLGMLGLCRMGANLTRRLMRGGSEFGGHVEKAAGGAR